LFFLANKFASLRVLFSVSATLALPLSFPLRSRGSGRQVSGGTAEAQRQRRQWISAWFTARQAEETPGGREKLRQLTTGR